MAPGMRQKPHSSYHVSTLARISSFDCTKKVSEALVLHRFFTSF